MPNPRLRRRMATLAAAALLAVSLVPVVAAPVGAAGGSGFVSMANVHRYNAGKGPVALHSLIDQIAVERGRQLVAAGQIGHDFDYVMDRFGDLGICWQSFGEIVAWNSSGDFSTFGTQWMNSTTHRNIMLGDYTHAGGSREQAGSRWYGVMIFVKLCNAGPSAPTSSGFVDLGTSTFIDDIEWLVERGITSGCAPSYFCPTNPVARGQMASFLQRAFVYPGTSTDFFTDDESSTHESAINRTRQAEVTSGCAATRFCPVNSVSRAQMASFLARALGLPPAAADHFSDDNGSTHEDAINRLAEAGIASGCAASRFCPDRAVTREQMAAFLHRALD